MKKTLSCRIAFVVFCSIGFTSNTNAHMPWLATDPDGHAILWFGDAPDDRTYPMPATIKAIELIGGASAVSTQPVENDSLVGMRSEKPIDAVEEVCGVVTYGLYHGTKLTYHVEHLPHAAASDWPGEPRRDVALQSVISASPSGGLQVAILRDGEPAMDVEVRLYCEEGHEEVVARTDAAGNVTFAPSEVEPGLNAVVVRISADAEGTLDGQRYESTTDILTATFWIARAAGETSNSQPKSESNSARPKRDGTGEVSIVPSDLPDLPEELTSFGAAVAGSRLYVYGGHTGTAHSYSIEEQSNRFWCLDTSAQSSGSWQSLPSGPSLQGLALVAHEDRIIRIGGFTAVNADGEPHDLRSQAGVAAFDRAAHAWRKLPSLPEPRSSLDAAVLGDTVYVFGGWRLSGEPEAGQWHATAWSLDLSDAAATWQTLAPPPFRRRAISVAAHDEKLFVIGGMTSDGKPTTQVDVFDPALNTWSDGPPLPGSGMSGFGSASFATGGKLYVSTMDGFVHELGHDHQSWKSVARSEPARFFHRMLPTADEDLLLIGGANMQIGKFTQIDRVKLP